MRNRPDSLRASVLSALESTTHTTSQLVSKFLEDSLNAAHVVADALPREAVARRDSAQVEARLKGFLDAFPKFENHARTAGLHRDHSHEQGRGARTVQDPAPGFDLDISDISMPGITGKELAEQVMAIRPGQPFIICTGFSEAMSEETAAAMGIRGLLMKPVAFHDFARAVSTALNSA